MVEQSFDVAVVGAGHAGLATSYFLTYFGIHHIVLERGRIGESWRTQRWNSFVLNSPNKFNSLPGDAYKGTNPDGFDSAQVFVSNLERYAKMFQLPVEEHARVISVERHASRYRVTALVRGATRTYTCRQVVVASGGMNHLKMPSFANCVAYRNPFQDTILGTKKSRT